MAEPPEPGRRSRAPKPPEPLPRLWRVEPTPEPSDAAPAESSRKKRPKDGGKRGDQKTAGVEKRPDGTTKIEETPKFDTYETRQRVRWIIGSVLVSILLIAIVLVVRKVRQEEPVEVATGPDPRTRIAAEAKASNELEAKNLLENARLAAQNGKTDAALDLFNKVATSYPGTIASREAMEALDRHRKKLPLLGPSPADLAAGPRKPPAGTTVAASTGKEPENAMPTGPAPPEAGTAVGPKPPADALATGPTGPTKPAKPLPAGFKPKPETAIHDSGWPVEIVGDRDGAPMVFVPGGTFTMGRDDGESPERPAHQVALASYYIDRHEVTVGQFRQFVKETGRIIEPVRGSSRETPDPPEPSEDHPVVNVGARDAKAYCLWAGKALPTEAQWEMAARGEDGRIFPWGNDAPKWDPPRAPRQIDPVMSQTTDVSPFGAFDMAGNAWEWTGDIYDSRYFQQFRNMVAKDPIGPPQIRSRPILVAVKGGSTTWQAFWRDGIKVELRHPYLGFRGALQADPPATPAPGPATAPRPSGGAAPTGGVVPF